MITKDCQYCGTTFTAKTERAKWCKKSCGQRAYEERKGLQKPKFISKYEGGVSGTIPTRTGATANHLEHQSNSKVYQLRKQKQRLMNRFLAISNKQEVYSRRGSFFGVVIGLAFGLKLSEKTDNGLLASLASAGLFGYVGNMLGNQYGEKNDKDLLKLRSIKSEMAAIDNEINMHEIVSKSIGDFKFKNKGSLATSLTGLEISKMKFDSYTVDGKYKELIGEVERGFNMAIYGPAGSGKSSIAIDLITDLKNHGKVIYFATEEGISQSLSSKIKKYHIFKTQKLGNYKARNQRRSIRCF